MKCEKCGRLATTHIHSVINGIVTEKHLCGYCAANVNYDKFGTLGVMNLLANVFNDETLNPKLESGSDIKCKNCGATFKDIAESGLIGCYKCYETFNKQLFPTIKRIHGKTRHIGKIPLVSSPRIASTPNISVLKAKLKVAIQNENFEYAAVLRDQIKELEGQSDE